MKVQGKVKNREKKEISGGCFWLVEFEGDEFKYSLWDEELLDILESGNEVVCDYDKKESKGKTYRNLSSAELTKESPKPSQTGEKKVEKPPVEKDKWEKKDQSIVQQCAGKIAAFLLVGDQSMSSETKMELWKKNSREIYKELKKDWNSPTQ